MEKSKKPKQDVFEAMEVFQRARWKHGIRIFGIIVIATLNFSLIMSNVERVTKHYEVNLGHELIQYLVLIFVDLTMLLPIIFEVDKVIVQDSRLTLRTMFWTAKLAWNEVLSFKTPNMLKFAIVKTKKCFYLINRRDIKGYATLGAIIEKRINQGPLK